jgi:hypothetical protein
MSVTALNHAYWVALINSIAHSVMPSMNPPYHHGCAGLMRHYYYF